MTGAEATMESAATLIRHRPKATSALPNGRRSEIDPVDLVRVAIGDQQPSRGPGDGGLRRGQLLRDVGVRRYERPEISQDRLTYEGLII